MKEIKLPMWLTVLTAVLAVLDVGLVLVNGYYIPLIVRLTGELPPLVTFGLGAVLFIVPMGLTLRYLRTHYGNGEAQSSSGRVIHAKGQSPFPKQYLFF